jgi:glucosamine--fructose-6-phosphate aminotransferase (isomerizing)
MIDYLARLPELGRRMLDRYASLAADLGADLSADRFYWLGTGSRYGLACEASLKMKEMSLTHSEPFHTLEYRHGPKSMVTETARVIGLLSDANGTRERAVLNEMSALGGRVFGVGEEQAEIEYRSGIPDPFRDTLFLPIAQSIAFHRSISKGLNPDLPTNLDPVVKL